MNMSEVVPSRLEGVCYSVTTGNTEAIQCVRNVFELQRPYSGVDAAAGVEVIRYGDKIRLCLTKLADVPLYLHSEILTPTTASKYSRHQSVISVPGDGPQSRTGNELWEVLPSDNRVRLEKVCLKEPLMQNDTVCLRHVGTGSLLASDSTVPQPNLFGREFEVACHCHQTCNKNHQLNNEKLGIIAAESPTRTNLSQTWWRIHG